MKVGDRVNTPEYGPGVIVVEHNNKWFGVKHDIYCQILHTCNGNCPDGYGYNYHPGDLVLLPKDNNNKVMEDNMERFMIYGTGCNNKSELYTSEKDMKKDLKVFSKDSSWTGRIIGYRLTPMYEAEEKTILKTFKTVKVKKVRKKK